MRDICVPDYWLTQWLKITLVSNAKLLYELNCNLEQVKWSATSSNASGCGLSQQRGTLLRVRLEHQRVCLTSIVTLAYLVYCAGGRAVPLHGHLGISRRYVKTHTLVVLCVQISVSFERRASVSVHPKTAEAPRYGCDYIYVKCLREHTLHAYWQSCTHVIDLIPVWMDVYMSTASRVQNDVYSTSLGKAWCGWWIQLIELCPCLQRIQWPHPDEQGEDRPDSGCVPATLWQVSAM